MDDDDGIVSVSEDDAMYASATQTPNIFIAVYNTVTGTLESYGWFILIGCILLYYLYNKIKERFGNFQYSVAMSVRADKKADDNVAYERMLKLEEVRRRQQAAIDEAAAKFLLEKKLKDEEKLKERIADVERLQQGLSYRSKIKPTNEEPQQKPSNPSNSAKPKPKLRPADYNPLTGSSSSGGSCAWRPGKKGPARGG